MAKATVCKTVIPGFNSRCRLHLVYGIARLPAEDNSRPDKEIGPFPSPVGGLGLALAEGRGTITLSPGSSSPARLPARGRGRLHLMNSTNLPSLRTRSSRAAGECSHCGGREFETQHGRGPIYWWGGIGSAIRLADADAGPRLDAPITCASCGAEHQPIIELPPIESDPHGATAQR